MKKVFVVHGHNHHLRDDVVKYLAHLELVPIVLADQDPLGGTIIEKFERYAHDCDFAIAILTPDDKSAEKLGESDKWRARQNVIFEMGWFMAKLTRRRVMLLYMGEVELPSDVTGIEYVRVDKSLFEVSEKIKQRLRGVGMI